MDKRAIWSDKAIGVTYPKLEEEIEVDIAIIGGGIAGLTAALELCKSGKSVAVLESRELGGGATGASSCHLTTDIDYGYVHIVSDFNEDVAKVVASSRVEAINYIERTIAIEKIECNFSRLPGYLYAEKQEQVSELNAELEAALKSGLNVAMTESVPLPFKVKKAMRFEDQAQFNSQQYLEGLGDCISCYGGQIYEHSRVISLTEENGKHIVRTEGGSVKASYVFEATQYPISINLLQTVASPFISYMVAARLRRSEYPVGLFWDMEEPYHYTRFYQTESGVYVVVGGEDHKTGKDINQLEKVESLKQYVKDRFDVEQIDYVWSAQYYEPVDGLPFIGKSPMSKNLFLATGYSGDGLVYGTLAGLLISDLIMEKENKWAAVYDTSRFTPAITTSEFIKENMDVAKHFIKDRFGSEVDIVSEISPGEGQVLRVDGERVAVSRDKNYDLHAVSPVCTHMKCVVHWNSFEQTWDCPCHGSRYSADGEVIYGPAMASLEKIEVKIKEKSR